MSKVVNIISCNVKSKGKYMKLTVRQAYEAMFDFLNEYYHRTGKPDEIGGLLGDLSFLDTCDEPYDPAMWSDWLKSVGKIEKGIPINIKKGLPPEEDIKRD